jgi:hypothetical protein
MKTQKQSKIDSKKVSYLRKPDKGFVFDDFTNQRVMPHNLLYRKIMRLSANGDRDRKKAIEHAFTLGNTILNMFDGSCPLNRAGVIKNAPGNIDGLNRQKHKQIFEILEEINMIAHYSSARRTNSYVVCLKFKADEFIHEVIEKEEAILAKKEVYTKKLTIGVNLKRLRELMTARDESWFDRKLEVHLNSVSPEKQVRAAREVAALKLSWVKVKADNEIISTEKLIKIFNFVNRFGIEPLSESSVRGVRHIERVSVPEYDEPDSKLLNEVIHIIKQINTAAGPPPKLGGISAKLKVSH